VSELSAEDFEVIARLAHDRAGLVLGPAKRSMVAARLVRRMRATGLEDYAEYRALIERDAAERAAMIAALTTNHTSFFREPHHFEHLAEWAPRAARPPLLWSAGCASGEEPYSMAITLLEAGATEARILATDIAPHAVAAARAGRYPEAAVAALAPTRQRHFLPAGTGAREIAPRLRAMVTANHLNLLEEWPLRHSFDAIFCRNVLIYFDDPTRARVIARLAARLVPGGFLYLGHSERLLGPAADCLRAAGLTIWRRED
jgi:chemotaxis protein methyltransferase CheR